MPPLVYTVIEGEVEIFVEADIIPTPSVIFTVREKYIVETEGENNSVTNGDTVEPEGDTSVTEGNIVEIEGETSVTDGYVVEKEAVTFATDRIIDDTVGETSVTECFYLLVSQIMNFLLKTMQAII